MDKSACDSLLTRSCYRKLLKNGNLEYYELYLSKKITMQELHSILTEKEKLQVINKEINDDTLEGIFEQIDSLRDSKEIEGIIGGPPCQAYSTIGRARNKIKVGTDERIYLYEYYVKFLEKYKPNFFLFENVKGLLSFKDQYNESLFPKIISEFQNCGYEISSKLINVAEYGISQKRERLFLFGIKRTDSNRFYSSSSFFDLLMQYKEPPVTINELFSDLPILHDGEVNNFYSGKSRVPVVSKFYRNYNITLSLNVARKHNERDKEIYRLVVHKKKNNEQLKYYELPPNLKTHKNVNSFVDRYKAIKGDNISHTIVAHISKDGHYYIHPDELQNRSITVREAARIQGFPDNYYFENSRTSAFKQIGNAVPPFFSHKLAQTLLDKIYN